MVTAVQVVFEIIENFVTSFVQIMFEISGESVTSLSMSCLRSVSICQAQIREILR